MIRRIVLVNSGNEINVDNRYGTSSPPDNLRAATFNRFAVLIVVR